MAGSASGPQQVSELQRGRLGRGRDGQPGTRFQGQGAPAAATLDVEGEDWLWLLQAQALPWADLGCRARSGLDGRQCP